MTDIYNSGQYLRHAREEVGHLHYFNRYTAPETLKYTGFLVENAFLSAAFRSTPPRNPRQALVLVPRLLLSLAGDRACAAVVDGYSLVVLATKPGSGMR